MTCTKDGGIKTPLWKLAKKVADRIKSVGEGGHILLVSHHDADGISSAAIALKSLIREGISCNHIIVQSLDDIAIDSIKKEVEEKKPDLVWFTDLGSGALSKLQGINAVFCDHHELDTEFLAARKNLVTDLLELSNNPMAEYDLDDLYMVNPHLVGKSGDSYISGSGTTYITAKAMNRENADLANIAIIGAVGDMMDKETGRLEGMNREILEDAVDQGLINVIEDIRGYGRQTRKISYFVSDLEIAGAGLKGDWRATARFLKAMGIEDKTRWWQLSESQKIAIISALIENTITEDPDIPPISELTKYFGEVYILPNEDQNTELAEAREFSTLLNSCGRHGHADAGIQVCLGDRDYYYMEAKGAVQDHRKQISSSISVAEKRLKKREVIQVFNGGNDIGETIVGSVAGKLYNTPTADADKVIIGIAQTRDGTAYKISARAHSSLLNIGGLNLHEVMAECSRQVGGVGGGHEAAAGATIPLDKLEEFLEMAERMIKKQMGYNTD